MRTKLLFFFFLLMLLQVNMSTSAMVLKDAHRIMLKDIKASGSHRSMPVLPTAFIDGSLLSVDFLSAVTSAAVTVRNSATGEIYDKAIGQLRTDGGAYTPTPTSVESNISGNVWGIFRVSAYSEKGMFVDRRH